MNDLFALSLSPCFWRILVSGKGFLNYALVDARLDTGDGLSYILTCSRMHPSKSCLVIYKNECILKNLYQT